MKKILIVCLVLALIGAGLLAYALFIEPNRLVVNQTEIRLPGWDKNLDGLRIVAISDTHGGSNFIDEAKLREVVAKANEQQPDVVVLLGDYVSQQYWDRSKLKMPVATVADNLSGLKAKYGVYAVVGNHDYWYGDNYVRGELERVGYRVLEDEIVSIRTEKGVFRILGLKEVLKASLNWQIYSETEKNVLAASEEKEGKIIALGHNPDVIDMVAGDYLISNDLLMLMCGHTHGGQVWLPLIGSPIVPSSYGQKYARGVIQAKGITMFVTTGVGTSILPVRFGVPPEISVVTLRSAD